MLEDAAILRKIAFHAGIPPQIRKSSQLWARPTFAAGQNEKVAPILSFEQAQPAQEMTKTRRQKGAEEISCGAQASDRLPSNRPRPCWRIRRRENRKADFAGDFLRVPANIRAPAGNAFLHPRAFREAPRRVVTLRLWRSRALTSRPHRHLASGLDRASRLISAARNKPREFVSAPRFAAGNCDSHAASA
jgi:hypothetical protein